MKVLVFGKTGQVARSLATSLATSPAARQPALDSVELLDRGQADLAQPDSARRAVESRRPDIVINAAAYTAVDQAEREPDLAMTVNARAPAAMAEACARSGAWLVHYSTDYVFDGSAAEPYKEDDAVSPINVYGRTKLAGEEAVRDAHERHLILRTSWVYSNFGKNFLNTMLRLAGERDTLRIVADQIGGPTWAGAIAEATGRIVQQLATAQRDSDDLAGTYHMTCGGRASWYEFACRIFELSGQLERLRVEPIETHEFPTPAARPLFSVLSNDKLERTFGVRLDNWDDALRQCLSERDARQQ